MAGALCSTLLAGCGGTKEAPTGNSSAADNSATAADDNTLTVWCWDPAFNINAMKRQRFIRKITLILS